MEGEQEHYEDERHADPLEDVEVAVEVVQSVGGVVVGVEHHHVGFIGYGVADAVVVGVLAAYGVVGAAHGGEA